MDAAPIAPGPSRQADNSKKRPARRTLAEAAWRGEDAEPVRGSARWLYPERVRADSLSPRLPDGAEQAQLGDVAGVELGDAGDLEQLHGADDLVAQDLDGPVDAGPAARHQAVQVGAADQGELGAERARGHAVAPVHHAGVHRALESPP